ncbi:MAG TPA: ABC transporter ATP-binding protein [Dehalococcoidia bacterium]|jgi:oligopeptide/dipeptide ABC transporter ATP-binding protein|nr:peptide ABC transporter ATP-binding protein [Dehalococcoidia bacterium]MCH2516245.1 ABC transporter ATP-binding protein [Dehalococcoidia bacterium]MEE2840893.1 ABC transporter ATP-binding protein [Chloroflexota bacterium]HIM60472.1 ABC transporter ATP-binding protein [Dehalococcoidia bacterium]HIN14516.1 ABC transporter ATP-binding protein [Dehalococcoidia bacterium]
MTAGSTSKSTPLLQVRNLRTSFNTPDGKITAVAGVTFDIHHGETLGLVGESGCGKSVTALSIMQLVPNPPGVIEQGEVMFDGTDLLKLSNKEMQAVRGSGIGMIFQEPMSSLNPVLSIGRQITEPLEVHLELGKAAALDRAAELLNMVGIADSRQRLDDYPHQLSGGQRQRVMIAIALSCEPKLLIADEATTALDVTIQAQILELMKNLTSQLGTALLIITHNLGIIARYADRLNVMYAGKIRESGTAEQVYLNPAHPYTIGLLNSVPRLDRPATDRLDPIPGEIPDPSDLPTGCAFRPRCRWATTQCEVDEPPLEATGVQNGRTDAQPANAPALVACFEANAVATSIEMART